MYWIRTVVNDEFVAYAKPTAKGIQMMEPTIVVTYNNTMLLTPYGTMSRTPGVFIKSEHILHHNEVTAVMKTLYETSTASATGDFVQRSFDQVILHSIDEAIRTADSIESPSADGVTVVHKNDIGGDSRDDAIDRLVKLAEEAGKGKKV